MTDVIILYSGEDEALTAPIFAQAKALGLDIRAAAQRDQDDLDADAIEAQIDEAGALLVCWSEHAVGSGAIRTRAAIASARGKLAACRLGPCSIPFPFDAVPTADLQNGAEQIEASQWRMLIATIGEKLHRPGLLELLHARISGDDKALESFVKRFPEEPEARRIWTERESKYRDECASMLRDARQHLEQRVASEQTKIENALSVFARDFDTWLERERRGEASAKPSLNTLFEIWLERGGRRGELKSISGPAATDKSADDNAARSETRVLELQQRLEAESEKAQELERRLRAAELQSQGNTPLQAGELIVLSPISSTTAPIQSPPTPVTPARPKRRRGAFVAVTLIGLTAIGAAAYAKYIHGTEREPPQLSAAAQWLQSTSATVAARTREAATDFIARQAGGEVLNELLSIDKDQTIARAIASDPQKALAHLKELAPDQFAGVAPPAPASPDALLASSSPQEKQELVSAVVKSAPSEVLAQLLSEKKGEVLDQIIRSERQALAARMGELAPLETASAAPATVQSATAPEPSAPAATPQMLARLTQLPPREIYKALESNVSPQNLTELGKLLSSGAAQKVANYRTYDNRDIESDEVVKLRNFDLQGCVTACRKKESCKAYTFDKWNRVCYLKSAIGSFKLNPRSSSGVREDVRIPKGPAGDVIMERYPSKAFPGSGYRSVKSDGAESCEHTCRTDEACIAFTYRLDEGSCHLFKTTGEYFNNELADSGGKRQE